MNKMQKGFTLIELMIVVAIIAILAAIALPAYQDYTVRAKLTEDTIAADACKNSVAEFYQDKGTLPSTLLSAGCNDQASKYVKSVNVAAGVITVTTTNDPGLYQAAGLDFVLTPKPTTATATTDSILLWTCTSSIPAKYLPATCR